jgi:hypothetical protein
LDGERVAPGGIRIGVATEKVDRGALGEWGEAELAERNEIRRNRVIIFISTNLVRGLVAGKMGR